MLPHCFTNHIAIIFSRFGPYHIARLEATGWLVLQHDFRLYGIDVSCYGGTYSWDKVTFFHQTFERITLFPELGYHSIPRSEIFYAISDALDRIDPLVVAIPGWSSSEAVAALIWCQCKHRRAICMSDSKADDMPRSWWKEWTKNKFFMPRFSAALVAGQPHAAYICDLDFSPEKIFLGYDVVDNQYFARQCHAIRQDRMRWSRERKLPRPFFLIVARFIPVKNLTRALYAYSQYRKTVTSPWDLVIAGSGELEGELHAQAEHLGLTGVHWLGFVQYPELPIYYALASALLFPSIKDTWGLAVNEAMAAGLPVLVSQKAGCTFDLVEDGRNGFLFDPFRVEEIADAMRRMSELSDEARAAMGRRSQEIIAEWGPDRFAQGMMQAVEKAMEGPPPQRSLSLLDKAIFKILARKG